MIKVDFYPTPTVCADCGSDIEYVSSSYVYGKDYGMIYICKLCDSFVGVHKGTEIPLGPLANKEQRMLRSQVHELFDKKWSKRIKNSRNKAYEWLAKMLEMKKVHIAWLTKDELIKAKEILIKENNVNFC